MFQTCPVLAGMAREVRRVYSALGLAYQSSLVRIVSEECLVTSSG